MSKRAELREGSSPRTHGGVIEVPVEALLAPDPDLRMAWAPLAETSLPCPYGACAAEACTCCTKMLPRFGVPCHELEGFRRENWCAECLAFDE